ncbi:MAG: DUF3052 domain-containing protein [Acidobacteriota bacterium]
MAGYSGTPLAKKLGFREGFRAGVLNAPNGFPKELAPLPNAVTICVDSLTKPLDLIILFADSQKTVKAKFSSLAGKLAQNGMLWIAWPKKASGVQTDLSENNIRDIGLNAGLVDVKVCAINEVWSGLKFVYRLKNRKLR